MFVFGLISQVLIYGTTAFLQPTLAIHLKSYEMETFWIGVFFSLPAVAYILGALLVPSAQSLIGRRGLIFTAFMMLLLSVILIGTSPMFRIRDSPKIVFSGLCLLGLSASAITIPVLPEMLDSIVQKWPQLENTKELNDVSAGYFNGSLGIGEALGPAIASLLVASMGFRSSCDVLAMTILVYTLLFFLFNGRQDIF